MVADYIICGKNIEVYIVTEVATYKPPSDIPVVPTLKLVTTHLVTLNEK